MPTLDALPVTTKKLSDVSTHAVIGARLSVVKTDTGVHTMLPATTFDRTILMFGSVTEAFAETTGTMTSFKVGQTGTDDKFGDTAGTVQFPASTGSSLDVIASQIAPTDSFNGGPVRQFALSANCALIVTVTPATGDGTGGIDLAIMAFA